MTARRILLIGLATLGGLLCATPSRPAVAAEPAPAEATSGEAEAVEAVDAGQEAAGSAEADGGIEWMSDLAKARERAGEQDTLVFIDFMAEWCGPCKQMDATVFPDAELQERLGKLVAVRIDIDEQEDLAREYRIQGVPTLMVMEPSGDVIARRSGFAPAPVLLAMFDYAKAKQTLNENPDDPEAAFLVATGSGLAEVEPAERTKMIERALKLMPKDDAEKRGQLLLARAVTKAQQEKFEAAMADVKAARELDPENELGLREQADWWNIQLAYSMREQGGANQQDNTAALVKAVDEFLATYAADVVRDQEVRNRALMLKYQVAASQQNFDAAIETLEAIKAENPELNAEGQVDAAIQQLRQAKAQSGGAQDAEGRTVEPAPEGNAAE